MHHCGCVFCWWAVSDGLDLSTIRFQSLGESRRVDRGSKRDNKTPHPAPQKQGWHSCPWPGVSVQPLHCFVVLRGPRHTRPLHLRTRCHSVLRRGYQKERSPPWLSPKDKRAGRVTDGMGEKVWSFHGAGVWLLLGQQLIIFSGLITLLRLVFFSPGNQLFVHSSDSGLDSYDSTSKVHTI